MKRKDLVYFSLKHGEGKAGYYTLHWKTLWFLLLRSLQGWTVKMTVKKGVDREEYYIEIHGER